MLTLILILSSMMCINLLFTLLYMYYKTENGLQKYQQSAYNSSRYFKYIKENYKHTLGINELILIGLAILLRNMFFWELLVTTVIMYYNLQFFQISKKRYKEKLPLKKTPRVKRFIAALIFFSVIILIVGLGIMVNINSYIKLFVLLTIITYLINFLIIGVGIFIFPLEKMIQNKFKKKAKLKLKKYDDLNVIAVTGSYGKTSIKNIVTDMLCEFELTLKTPSSFNTPMGISITVNNELTPFYKNFITEMGAYYLGEIKELADLVNPKIGIVSSVGPQHLETFKTIDVITKTKMELIESLPKDGLGILNFDNKYIREYKIINDVKIKWYSLENDEADIKAFDITYLTSGMEFSIKFKGKTHKIKTTLLGKHNVSNILASILVLDYKQISIENIINSIDKIQPIPHRLELKQINNNLTLIDDSFNGNVEGVKEGLKILESMNQKRKILITPGIIDGGKENENLNIEYGKAISNAITDIIIIGKYNQNSLKKGIKSEYHNKIKNFDNFIEGYNYAMGIDESKIILIANDLPDKYNN